MSPRDAAIGVFVMFIWGVNFAVAKTGLAEIPPLLLMAMRFGLVAALLVPFVQRPKAPLVKVLGVGFTLGFLHFALFFSGLKGLDAAVAAVVIQLQVPFAVLLAAIFLRERPGWRRSLGVALAFSGVAIIFARPNISFSGHLPYLGLMLAAAVVWATANFQIKSLAGVDGMALNGWIALVAAPLLLAASFFLEHGQIAALGAATWRGYGSVLFMAVCSTIVGYGLWYYLVRKYPMSLAMPFTLLAPIFGVASGVVLLHEAFTLRMAIGSAITIAGVGVIVLRRPRLEMATAESAGGVG